MPWHPSIVHIPLVLAIVLPILILVFALMMKSNKMAPSAWLLIIGLQLITTISGYVSLETGETEEDVVSKVVEKSFIHEHEEAAEIFVGSTVIALVLGIATYFIQKQYQFMLQLIICVLTLGSSVLGYRAGHLGGELVYKKGAASVYSDMSDDKGEGLLPTPGLNTSESSMPEDDNESLKKDDHDYGNADAGVRDEEEARDE